MVLEYIYNEVFQGITHAKCKKCPYELDFIGWSPDNVYQTMQDYNLQYQTEMPCLHELILTTKEFNPCFKCKGKIKMSISGNRYCIECGEINK